MTKPITNYQLSRWTTPRFVLLLLSSFLLLVGCFSFGSEPTRYYTLIEKGKELPAELAQTEQIDEAVRIRDTEIQEAYDRRQIVERVGGPRIRYLSSHLWAGSVSRGTADMLAQRLGQTQLFAGVIRKNRDFLPRYELQSSVDRLELTRDGDTGKSYLHLRLTLRDRNSDAIVLSKEKHRTAELSGEVETDFVRSYQEFVIEQLDQFLIEAVDLLYAAE